MSDGDLTRRYRVEQRTPGEGWLVTSSHHSTVVAAEQAQLLPHKGVEVRVFDAEQQREIIKYSRD